MSASRFALPLAALLLGCTALSGGAQAGWLDFGSGKEDAPAKAAVVKSDAVQPAPTLDGSIRQAQLLRLAGQYPDAIKHLSQLMMVASDDSRVISEYGKTLAAMGRAQEALNFLGRAQQMMPTDWTVYSALGVAYDQLGKPSEAQAAYEHALTLQPGEPSVLNNYALSRMLAKDPEGARKLIARAESAGGSDDPKIARNIALIKDLAPETAPVAVAAAAPRPAAPQTAPQAAPRPPVAQRALPVVPQAVASSAPFVTLPPSAAPRPLLPNAGIIEASTPAAPRVVMQRVPVDPLAGPVLPKIAAATHAPRPLVAKADKPAEAPTPVKTAATEALDLQTKADAIARKLAGKPEAIAAAKAEASKPMMGRPDTKADAGKPATKPAAAPAKPQAAKLADAKPAKATKDSIPGLRLSANAY